MTTLATIRTAAANLTAGNLSSAIGLNCVTVTDGPEFITVQGHGLTLHVHTDPMWIALNSRVCRGVVTVESGPENADTEMVWDTVTRAAHGLFGTLPGWY